MNNGLFPAENVSMLIIAPGTHGQQALGGPVSPLTQAGLQDEAAGNGGEEIPV